MIAWRSQAALAHFALDERARGVELAEEKLRLARRFGAPRAIGIALRALGVIERGERRIGLLREAVSVLEASDARLEHARARRSRRRAAPRQRASSGPRPAACSARARHPLWREAPGGAGAGRAARHRREAALACAHRPTSAHPIERQAASMAAQGLANPQIAQALFISRKTVEKRLSEAYRKLGIGSRTELAASLAGPVGTAR